MVHHRQRLPLLFETRNDLLGVHSELDDFQGHASPHWTLLFRNPDGAKTALANLLEQLVMAHEIPGAFPGPGCRRVQFGGFQEISGHFICLQ